MIGRLDHTHEWHQAGTLVSARYGHAAIVPQGARDFLVVGGVEAAKHTVRLINCQKVVLRHKVLQSQSSSSIIVLGQK